MGLFRSELPKESDFPEGTEFYIREFDVPLAWLPSGQWVNWYGGSPSDYPPHRLKPGDAWLAESFEEWLAVIHASR